MWGVKEGGRVAPWDAVGGGGGMLGGVDRGCVFTSAGESGIAAAFSFLSAKEKERKMKRRRAELASQHLGRGLRASTGQVDS